MPRLSKVRYLAAHDFLRHLSLRAPNVLAYCLLPKDHAPIYQFFLPLQDLTRDELLAYRRTVSAEQPSLPQRAGRALARFEAELDAFLAVAHDPPRSAPARTGPHTGPHHISVRSVQRAEPDMRMLARALISLAKEQHQAELEKQRTKKRDDI